MRKAGTPYFLTQDHLGGTALITDANVDMAARVRYYPYGTVRTQELGAGLTALPTDKLFTGQQRETANGIYHYNARQYNTDIGRFPQADNLMFKAPARDREALNAEQRLPDAKGLLNGAPAAQPCGAADRSRLPPDMPVVSAGDPRLLNEYSYAADNPVNYVDRTGQWFEIFPLYSFDFTLLHAPGWELPNTGPAPDPIPNPAPDQDFLDCLYDCFCDQIPGPDWIKAPICAAIWTSFIAACSVPCATCFTAPNPISCTLCGACAGIIIGEGARCVLDCSDK
jgi:RHS repeat-associated protein